MWVFVQHKMVFVIFWIEHGCKQAEVHAVAVALHGVLQLSQLLDDIFLMNIFPQSPTLNKMVVMSNYSPGEGQLWCGGIRGTRRCRRIVLSPNHITLWKWTKMIPNNMLIAIGILSKLKNWQMIKRSKKASNNSDDCNIWHLKMNKHSPFTEQQTAIQHSVFAFFPFALSKGFKEKLTVAKAVWAAMMFQNAKLYWDAYSSQNRTRVNWLWITIT